MSSPAMSDYLAKKLLNQLFRSTSFTFPTSMWLSLCNTTPTFSDTGTSIAIGAAAGTGVEVTGTSYVRAEYDPGTGNWSTASGSGAETTSNLNDVVFATAGGSWGTITGGAITDNDIYEYSSLTFTNSSTTVNMADTTGLHVGDPVWLTDGSNTLSTTIATVVTNDHIVINNAWSFSTTSGGTLTDGGNALFYFALSANKTVSTSDVFQFLTGNFSIELQ